MRFAKLSRDVLLDADEQYPVHQKQIYNDLLEESRPLKLALTLPTEDDEYQWELLEPSLLLAHVVGSCPALQDVYRVALEAWPPTLERPWDLMLCYDEFRPGDLLNYESRYPGMERQLSAPNYSLPTRMRFEVIWAVHYLCNYNMHYDRFQEVQHCQISFRSGSKQGMYHDIPFASGARVTPWHGVWEYDDMMGEWRARSILGLRHSHRL